MKYIKLYSNCIYTKGYKRSLYSDLQRKKSELIPNDLTNFIQLLENKRSLDQIFQLYGTENKKTIQEYISFIIDNEYGFFVTESEFDYFPKLDLTFKHPSKITNAIIYQSGYNESIIKKIIKQLEDVSCKDIVFIFTHSLSYENYKSFNSFFSNTRIKSIEIFTKYSKSLNYESIKNINFDVLTKLYFHNSNKEEVITYNEEHFFDVIYLNFLIEDFKFCGVVKEKYFFTNLNKVTESKNHNSCLNRKISIDKEGNIRNCPSMPESHGNINDTTLQEAINKPGFKKYWNITKDDIEVCKDCEFRHVCTDCRAYTERSHFNDKGLDLSKPLKCGYNPYTNEWAEWSTNPLKEKAIEYYGMQELVKKVD